MTTTQDDLITDIQFNFSPAMQEEAIASLTEEELLALKIECRHMVARQNGILMRVEQRLNFLTSKGC